MLTNHKPFLSKLFLVLFGGGTESNRHMSNSSPMFFIWKLSRLVGVKYFSYWDHEV
jgi:hypothetical protein